MDEADHEMSIFTFTDTPGVDDRLSDLLQNPARSLKEECAGWR